MNYLYYILFCISVYISECPILATISFIMCFVNGLLTIIVIKSFKKYITIKNKRA
jgi:hypothetical protein